MKFNGLTDREVEESREKHGSNAILIQSQPLSGRNLRRLSGIR